MLAARISCSQRADRDNRRNVRLHGRQINRVWKPENRKSLRRPAYAGVHATGTVHNARVEKRGVLNGCDAALPRIKKNDRRRGIGWLWAIDVEVEVATSFQF